MQVLKVEVIYRTGIFQIAATMTLKGSNMNSPE
jgi:hypothetical protein